MIVLGLAGALAACDPSSFGPAPTPAESGALPGTSIVPRPLEDPRADGGAASRASQDAGEDASDAAPPPPEPLEPDEALTRDEAGGQTPGLRLDLAVRWRGIGGPPQLTEVDAAATERLRKQADGELRALIGATGRLRLEVGARGFTLPEGTSIVARTNRYGHILVWPGESRYRIVPVGALRAIFGEARADVGQVVRGTQTSLPKGQRLGLPTRRVELSSPLGVVVLDMAEVDAAGAGAGLLCRLFLDIAGIDPSNDVCDRGEIALAADYRWHRGGAGALIEVTQLTALESISEGEIAMPPRRARFALAGLPPRPPVFFGADELATLRTQSIELGPLPVGTPERGIEAVNRSNLAMFVVVDGIPVALVAPWETVTIGGLRPGRYVLQWRSFLGDVVEPAAEQVVPVRLVYGEPLPEADRDAGG